MCKGDGDDNPEGLEAKRMSEAVESRGSLGRRGTFLSLTDTLQPGLWKTRTQPYLSRHPGQDRSTGSPGPGVVGNKWYLTLIPPLRTLPSH